MIRHVDEEGRDLYDRVHLIQYFLVHIYYVVLEFDEPNIFLIDHNQLDK